KPNPADLHCSSFPTALVERRKVGRVGGACLPRPENVNQRTSLEKGQCKPLAAFTLAASACRFSGRRKSSARDAKQAQLRCVINLATFHQKVAKLQFDQSLTH